MPGYALFADLRHAARLHARQPMFALVTIGMLALATGGATAVFSLVRAVILRDLPFADPDRLVWMYNARTERDRAPFSIPDLDDYRRDNTTLERLGAFVNWTANLTGGGDAERLEGTRVSGEFFGVLGARPLSGRVIDERDAAASERVAVVTYGLWMRRFGGDPQIVGAHVTLNGATFTLVGVMPRGFVFPFRDAEIAVPLPLRDDPRRSDRGANFLRVVARLKPGIAVAAAEADLDAIAHRLQRQYPVEDAKKTGVNLFPLHAEIVSDYRAILWTLFAAVVVLVAIGCGNLANLLLVRAAVRTPELALRLSLGASRGRLVRQMVAEAGLLAGAGGALGMAVARAALDAWRVFGPAAFPRASEVAMDVPVIAFAIALAASIAVVCGVVPAWIAIGQVADALRRGTRTLTASRRDGRVRRAFVMVQVAGAAVLLVCMALVARALARVESVDPGFTPDHALTVQLSLPPLRYGTRDAILALHDALRARMEAIPGARHVGVVSLLPLTGLLNTIDVAFPDRPAPPPDEVPQAHFRIASAGYFAAAGIRVIDGREFIDSDNARAAPVALVSRTLADRHWTGQRVVGKYIQIVQSSASPPMQIVGVVNDVKQFTADGTPTADLYIPLQQLPQSQAAGLAARSYWVVRTDGDPRRITADLRAAVHAVDRDIATSTVRTLDDVLDASLSGRRVSVWLLELFGQLAMALAAMGVYAIAAFTAAARTRELAIRAAFGASGRDLISLVVSTEYPAVCLGIVVGLALGRVAAQSLGSALFSIPPSDPGTYVSVACLLSAVTFIAAWLPAMRAGSVDPAALLRS